MHKCTVKTKLQGRQETVGDRLQTLESGNVAQFRIKHFQGTTQSTRLDEMKDTMLLVDGWLSIDVAALIWKYLKTDKLDSQKDKASVEYEYQEYVIEQFLAS